MKMFGEECTVSPHAAVTPHVDEAYRFTFGNGYGASVIRGAISGGHWELAVFGKDGAIDYTHPVSQGDVVRGSESEIASWLSEIKATP